MTEASNATPGENDLIDGNKLSVDVLKDLAHNNSEFFVTDSSENGQRLYISFLAIMDGIELLWPKVKRIESRCAEFDFDEETPGNGYRSFLGIVNLAIEAAIQLNKKVILKRNKVLFRKSVVAKYIIHLAMLTLVFMN